ncbi:uncharacterized protein PG986_014150 [Apiospora aurea]|uniref:Uncharacterized protein n=1 Tax=Apiospora aurea TaxID=335848 RepID=A0ABR1PS58_9PEZI
MHQSAMRRLMSLGPTCPGGWPVDPRSTAPWRAAPESRRHRRAQSARRGGVLEYQEVNGAGVPEPDVGVEAREGRVVVAARGLQDAGHVLPQDVRVVALAVLEQAQDRVAVVGEERHPRIQGQPAHDRGHAGPARKSMMQHSCPRVPDDILIRICNVTITCHEAIVTGLRQFEKVVAVDPYVLHIDQERSDRQTAPRKPVDDVAYRRPIIEGDAPPCYGLALGVKFVNVVDHGPIIKTNLSHIIQQPLLNFDREVGMGLLDPGIVLVVAFDLLQVDQGIDEPAEEFHPAARDTTLVHALGKWRKRPIQGCEGSIFIELDGQVLHPDPVHCPEVPGGPVLQRHGQYPPVQVRRAGAPAHQFPDDLNAAHDGGEEDGLDEKLLLLARLGVVLGPVQLEVQADGLPRVQELLDDVQRRVAFDGVVQQREPLVSVGRTPQLPLQLVLGIEAVERELVGMEECRVSVAQQKLVDRRQEGLQPQEELGGTSPSAFRNT